MKRFLLLGAFGLVLTACGGNASTPVDNNSVTGTWDGTFTYQGSPVVAFFVSLNQTNTPTSGDYTGTIGSADTTATSPVLGNVNQGTFGGVDGGAGVTCKGTFNTYTTYNGTCTISANGQSRSGVTVALKKR